MSSQSVVPPALGTKSDGGEPGRRPGETKLSPVEGIKAESRHLRGTIALQLLEDTDHFAEHNKQLLKFHGSYQQDDRDARKARSKDNVGKHYMFMVRCKIPGGRISADQYLALDDLAGKYANGTLRITTRQGVQLHGVLKKDLKTTIAGINQCLLTTLGACGDVERNVMSAPSPVLSPLFDQLYQTAAFLAAHLAPRSRAYHEIWLNGKLVEDSREPEIELLYGEVYLPRKFKTGLALPQDNTIDVYAQDLGLLAVVEDDRIAGYNVLVGGGMGMTHGNANTFPHVARPICYVPVEKVVPMAEAVIKLFRDHGNRSDRKRARIKYLVHDWGVERFREVLAEYVDFDLELPRPVDVSDYPLHLGWHAQAHGKNYYGISVENGRIKDEGAFRLRSALRALVERYKPKIHLTPVQDIILCNLPDDAGTEIEHTLRQFGVTPPDDLLPVRHHSMACPAIPTCGLAITESERVLPQLLDEFEAELKRLGLEKEKMSVRMTGCPNGCARPYQSDIGLVGRSGDKYTVFVGGSILGTRLNFALRDLVPQNQIVPLLRPLLEDFKHHRETGESFGDYCYRLGQARVQGMLPNDIGKVVAH
jgi:sulfite reductase (ferredoxin)